MAQIHLRKYGVQTTVNFTLYGITGVDLKTDAAHASGDTKIMKDEGAEANTTNGFTDEGQGYAIVLDATEMSAARIVLYVVDSATKVWLDTAIIIETYGNASAMHPFDLATATQSVNVSQISGDSTAADNAEAFFDGTGYAGTGNVIPTVTTVNGLAAGVITAASIAADAITAAKIADGAIDAGALASDTITAAKIAADAFTAAKFHSDVTTEFQNGLATAAALDTVDNFLDTEIAAIITTLGTPAGASISADIAAIEAQTDDIGAAGAGLSAIPWNAAWDAEVQSEVDDALVAQNLDHLVKIAVDTDFATTVHLNSVVGHLADNGTSATFDRTTDSLEALQAEHDSTQSSIAALNNLSSAQAQTAAAAALTAYDPPTNAEMEARTIAAANYATASALDTVDNFLDTEIAAIKAVTDALPDAGALTTIQSDLDNIQTRLPAALVSGRMDSNMQAAANGVITAAVIATDAIDNDAIAANAVTEIQSGLATSASISALNNLSAAQVNAEVVDALATDTYAEPGQGTPAATLSLAAKINYLFKAWRNKTTQTATTYSLFNDDAATVDQKATVSDDATTFTKGEVATGP